MSEQPPEHQPETPESPAAAGPQRCAILIGAGPAGLTAAYELLTRTDIQPIVLEAGSQVGGIAQTVNYKGNRIDIGGHRFFSKSDRVMQWWLDMMPMERTAAASTTIHYQGRSRSVGGQAEAPDPRHTDRVMLVRSRKSRIYFLRRFFDYPIRLSGDTIRKLGLLRIASIGVSYLWAAAFPYKDPQNLEQFLINRFGRQLYLTFFKSYTEKVWGERCTNISSQWGAQRIKGLSIGKALAHFFKGLFRRKTADVAQKDTETSLIEQFLYPKLGPGQMWEIVAGEVQARGGQVLMNHRVTKIHVDGRRITAVDALDTRTGQCHTFPADYFFSTMPVRELIGALQTEVPQAVREVAGGLRYRSFITVGLLLKELKIRDDSSRGAGLIADNWIYVQEPDVLVGRLQIFNNWSPYMVADPRTVWIGLEYFCDESPTDVIWTKSDAELIALAGQELERIGIIDPAAILDATVIRMPKTYPAYFGTYDRFHEVQAWLDPFENLFLVGRNGMHKYNNQDHSMLTAMVAVDNLLRGQTDKANLWAVNAEQEYHEEKSATA